jgi:hypothetical protein
VGCVHVTCRLAFVRMSCCMRARFAHEALLEAALQRLGLHWRCLMWLLVQSALKDYSAQLEGDPIVKRHLVDLFKALLEQNLIRIIKPYSKVQVEHLANLITLDAATVEREISQMILDKKVAGARPAIWLLAQLQLEQDQYIEPYEVNEHLPRAGHPHKGGCHLQGGAHCPFRVPFTSRSGQGDHRCSVTAHAVHDRMLGPGVKRLLSCGTTEAGRAGILDQGTGCLEVFEEPEESKAYPAAIEVVQNMGTVVNALFTRSQKLVA